MLAEDHLLSSIAWRIAIGCPPGHAFIFGSSLQLCAKAA